MSETVAVFLSAIACLVVSTALQPLVILSLRRASVLDVPSARSSHTSATLRGGGIALVIGLVASTLLAPIGLRLVFGLSAVTFAAIGLADDIVGISIRIRFLLQVAAAALIVHLLAPVCEWPLAVAVIATAWIVVLVNAFNFMDGINGISGWNVLASGTFFLLLGLWLNEGPIAGAGAALAAAGAAFLPWNAVRPKIFLGDVGSYPLGAALAILSVASLQAGATLEAVLGPAALYLCDTGWTLARRIRAGEQWWQPHRTHVYQRLCDEGMSHVQVAALTAGLAILLSLLGSVSLVGPPTLRIGADLLAGLLLVAYLRSPMLLRGRRTKRGPS